MDKLVITITNLLHEVEPSRKLKKLSLGQLAKLVFEVTDDADISGSVIIEIYDLLNEGLI